MQLTSTSNLSYSEILPSYKISIISKALPEKRYLDVRMTVFFFSCSSLSLLSTMFCTSQFSSSKGLSRIQISASAHTQRARAIFLSTAFEYFEVSSKIALKSSQNLRSILSPNSLQISYISRLVSCQLKKRMFSLSVSLRKKSCSEKYEILPEIEILPFTRLRLPMSICKNEVHPAFFLPRRHNLYPGSTQIFQEKRMVKSELE